MAELSIGPWCELLCVKPHPNSGYGWTLGAARLAQLDDEGGDWA